MTSCFQRSRKESQSFQAASAVELRGFLKSKNVLPLLGNVDQLEDVIFGDVTLSTGIR